MLAVATFVRNNKNILERHVKAETKHKVQPRAIKNIIHEVVVEKSFSTHI